MAKKFDPNHIYFKKAENKDEYIIEKLKDTTPDYDDDGFKIVKK
jgi:hypothetical protein